MKREDMKERKNLTRKSQISILASVAAVAGMITALVAVSNTGGVSADDGASDGATVAGAELVEGKRIDHSVPGAKLKGLDDANVTVSFNSATSELTTTIDSPELVEARVRVKTIAEGCQLDAINAVVASTGATTWEGSAFNDAMKEAFEADESLQECYKAEREERLGKFRGKYRGNRFEDLTTTVSFNSATSELTTTFESSEFEEPKVRIKTVAEGCHLDAINAVVASTGATTWEGKAFHDAMHEIRQSDESLQECFRAEWESKAEGFRGRWKGHRNGGGGSSESETASVSRTV